MTSNIFSLLGPTLVSTFASLVITLIVFSWKFSARFNTLEMKLDGLTGEVGGVKGEMKDIRSEIKDIRGEIKDMGKRIDGVRDELHDLKNKVTGMEVQVNMLIIHPEILNKGLGGAKRAT